MGLRPHDSRVSGAHCLRWPGDPPPDPLLTFLDPPLDYFIGKLNLFFSFQPRNFSKIIQFNLLILTPILTLPPQLSPNPNHKPHIKCARMNISQCSFSLCNIIFSDEIVAPNQICEDKYRSLLFRLLMVKYPFLKSPYRH